MCGRYARFSPKRRFAEALGLPDAQDYQAYLGDINPAWQMCPSLCSWIVRARSWGKPGFESFRWGLVPSWARDRAGFRPINARIETAADKPMFRKPMRTQRCLVPADGFYEWRKVAGGKQPHFIRRKGGEPMAFAGLWESWRAPGGVDEELTFTILTGEPNELTAQVHDRMPVILRPEHYMRWIDPAVTEIADVMAMAQTPYPAADMEMWPVSTRVNSPKNNGPELIEPVGAVVAG